MVWQTGGTKRKRGHAPRHRWGPLFYRCNLKGVAVPHMDNAVLSVSVQSLQSGCLSPRVSSAWSAQTCSSNAPSAGLLRRRWRGGWTAALCRVSSNTHSPKCCLAFWFLFCTPPCKSPVPLYRVFGWAISLLKSTCLGLRKAAPCW